MRQPYIESATALSDTDTKTDDITLLASYAGNYEVLLVIEKY